MRFIVIVAIYNMAQWVNRTIESIRTQSYRDFRCLLGDDLSTDNSVSVIRAAIADDPRFQLIINKEKLFSLGNTWALIEQARPEDEDVIVLVDGDDWLPNPSVLTKLADIYQGTGCWMTYGSHCTHNGDRSKICRPYPPKIAANSRFRSVKWRASHLKTFKYKLWQQIDPLALSISEAEFSAARRKALFTGHWRHWFHWRNIQRMDLLDPSGRFVRRCADKAMTLPMLEMAGQRAQFVEDILYVHNCYPKSLSYGTRQTSTPQRWYTRCIRDIVFSKPAARQLTESG